MRAETRAYRAAAASLCVLLTVAAPAAAQPPAALFLPAIPAELAGRN